MNRLAFYLLLALTFQSMGIADVRHLSPESRQVLEDSRRFHKVTITTDLPPAVLALCADHQGKLAEPGKAWEATDVVTDPSLPNKRLIWAAVADGYYVVHYERGGRGHSFHILLASFAKGDHKPEALWRSVGGPMKDYPAFLSTLHSGKLDDDPNSAH